MRYLPVIGVTTQDLANTYGAPRSGGRKHQGIDIFADEGTGVVATVGGTVVKAGDSGGLGGMRAWVRDDDGQFHYYAHLSAVDVKEGQRVEAGQRLGAVGNTGIEAVNTPPHLHYSVNPSGASSEKGSFDPYEYLLDANTASDSTEAMAQRHIADPVADPLPDPAQQFAQERQLQKDTVAGIMASVSRAARGSNDGAGRMLDVREMFGGMFGVAGDDREVA